jgi:hypothetical protein
VTLPSTEVSYRSIHLNAHSLCGIDLDHRDITTKGKIGKEPSHYDSDPPDVALVEWAKCESLCSMCHHKGVNNGGIMRRLLLAASFDADLDEE